MPLPISFEPPAFESRTRRWREQRWLVDAVIQTAGIDWDQPRTMAFAGPCGVEALGDFHGVTARIHKFSDMHREYAAAARRRVAKAEAFEAASRTVAARESWFIAAQLWACARWPVFEINALHREYDAQLRHAYTRFAALAQRPVIRVEIPFGNTALPAWLHLPHVPAPGERCACVVQIPGMDNNKEQSVALYGDKLLERGFAVLAVDGPGQAESVVRGIHVTPTNHADAGRAIFDWLAQRSEIDSTRVGLRGVSFGSFFALQMAAAVGTRCAGAVSAFVAHEPGLGTLFGHASPTFKVRFMMMAGYEDEDAFDSFVRGFDATTFAPELRSPVLFQAGEDDELSPLAYTERLFARITAPKRLVVYEGHKHVLRGPGSVATGESPDHLYADWLAERFAGAPMESTREWISMSGQATVESVGGSR